MFLLGIDPGNEESAYVIINENYIILEKGKISNNELLKMCKTNCFGEQGIAAEHLAVEMVASYGMAVGQTVFDTCVWIGRFIEALNKPYTKIYRIEEKTNICHDSRAKDANIRQALIDRFGIIGTKKSPGFFYGVKKDIWAAFAVACTYLDKKKCNNP